MLETKKNKGMHEIATHSCVMTAFFDRPTKRFTFRCCLIHLKNSSICHRDLYISAIVWATHVVLLVTNT